MQSVRARAGVSEWVSVCAGGSERDRRGERETHRESVCVCERERERERERVSETLRKRERERLLLCAALLPGWEVFSIERTRSVRHSRLVANPAFSLWPTARLSIRNKKRRAWRIREDAASPAPEWGNGSTWPIRKRNRGWWILFIRSPPKTARSQSGEGEGGERSRGWCGG